MGYKFNGKRYITRGINNTLPIDIQLILFQSIEVMRGKVEELDWLQVMTLDNILLHAFQDLKGENKDTEKKKKEK